MEVLDDGNTLDTKGQGKAIGTQGAGPPYTMLDCLLEERETTEAVKSHLGHDVTFDWTPQG